MNITPLACVVIVVICLAAMAGLSSTHIAVIKEHAEAREASYADEPELALFADGVFVVRMMGKDGVMVMCLANSRLNDDEYDCKPTMLVEDFKRLAGEE